MGGQIRPAGAKNLVVTDTGIEQVTFPGSLRAVTVKPSLWSERKARGGEARGLRVTCHRFPGAKLAEPCLYSRMG